MASIRQTRVFTLLPVVLWMMLGVWYWHSNYYTVLPSFPSTTTAPLTFSMLGEQLHGIENSPRLASHWSKHFKPSTLSCGDSASTSSADDSLCALASSSKWIIHISSGHGDGANLTVTTPRVTAIPPLTATSEPSSHHRPSLHRALTAHLLTPGSGPLSRLHLRTLLVNAAPYRQGIAASAAFSQALAALTEHLQGALGIPVSSEVRLEPFYLLHATLNTTASMETAHHTLLSVNAPLLRHCSEPGLAATPASGYAAPSCCIALLVPPPPRNASQPLDLPSELQVEPLLSAVVLPQAALSRTTTVAEVGPAAAIPWIQALRQRLGLPWKPAPMQEGAVFTAELNDGVEAVVDANDCFGVCSWEALAMLARQEEALLKDLQCSLSAFEHRIATAWTIPVSCLFYFYACSLFHPLVYAVASLPAEE